MRAWKFTKRETLQIPPTTADLRKTALLRAAALRRLFVQKQL